MVWLPEPFDGYLLVLLILLAQSFLDIRTLRRAKPGGTDRDGAGG